MITATSSSTATPSISTSTTLSIPATIPLPANPTGNYKSDNFNSSRSICFPEEPLTTEYQTQCWVDIFDSALINDKIAQSLIPCCYGRLDVVEGCGYQCISNLTDKGYGGITFDPPNKWWSQCLHQAALPKIPENTTNGTLDWDGGRCASRRTPNMAGGRALMEQGPLAIVLVLGVILPLIIF
ncbi:hypothetical protein TWF281_007718 [Arthrobotrys megalospora]